MAPSQRMGDARKGMHFSVATVDRVHCGKFTQRFVEAQPIEVRNTEREARLDAGVRAQPGFHAANRSVPGRQRGLQRIERSPDENSLVAIGAGNCLEEPGERGDELLLSLGRSCRRGAGLGGRRVG